MQSYVAQYPPELARRVAETDNSIATLWNQGRYAEAEGFFENQYSIVRSFESRLPDNQRFHKGGTLHNWGIVILLQKRTERLGDGFEKILLAYIEDLLDFDSIEQVQSSPAYLVLTGNQFFDRNQLDIVRQHVERRKSTGQIPKNPEDIVTPEVANAMQLGTRQFIANSRRVVFVVHGRNSRALESLLAFLRSIGLLPITLRDALPHMGQATPYVGDVLDRAFSLAHAVIVLMTPDDKGCLCRQFRRPNDPTYETRPSGQARLNVIFEAGLAMGGPFRDRTVLVELGNLRPFSDIGGRLTVRLNNTIETRQNLIARLQAINCTINLSSNDWRTAGDFEGVIQDHTNAVRKFAEKIFGRLI